MSRLLLLLALATSVTAQSLTPASVASHPGRWSGEYAAAVEDLLARLEADPASPLAATAWAEVADLARLGEVSLDPARLQRLVGRTPDALAHLRATNLLVTAARRTRFQAEPFVLAEDAWGASAVRGWSVVGPLGPLDHPAPLHLPPEPQGPEAGLAPAHPTSHGSELGWRDLTRPAGQLFVLPARAARHTGDGVLYLRAHVELLAAEALLELHCPTEAQVWWNGEQVFDLTSRGPGEDAGRFLVPVAGAGFNELLLRVENRVGSRVGVRFVDATTGRLVPFREYEGDDLPARPTFVAASVRVPAEEPPADGMARAVWALERVARGRADQALALDPLAPGQEEMDEATRDAWLRVRFEALARANHLPAEVERRALLAVEQQMLAAGVLLPEVLAQRVLRLSSEDRPLEALAALDELEATLPPCPTYAVLRAMALGEVDATGALTLQELRRLRAAFPGSGRIASLVADRVQKNDPLGALPHWRAALELAGEDQELQTRALTAMARAGGSHAEQAVAWIEAWRQDAPDLRRPRELLADVLRASGDDAGLRVLLAEDVARAALDDAASRRALADFLIERTDFEGARQILRAGLAAAPGDHGARATLSRLGDSHEAERFFRAFAPDREEALAAATGPHDASIAEALDSGLVYFYPDGSSHQRYHTITLALDRKGTELLHTEEVAEHARLAQVLKADGRVLEPSSVAGEWVMPSLEPGDAVELVWDQFTRGKPGAAPEIGWWRFSSFEKPFVRSRYVVYVPDGLPGELRTFQFDGAHEEVRFEGGTAHVFLARDRARQEEEALRPSFEEVLPWVQYGGDRPLAYVEALWRDRLHLLSHLPADMELELRALAGSLDPALSEHERAAQLFDAVTSHVLDFSGGGLAAQVWPSRRGNPIFLLGSLYELAGIEFEWALLEEAVAPELDPEPLQAFEDLRGYDVPALRLAGEPPVWVLTPSGRGEAFGAIPAGLAGAQVLVLQDEGARVESLPRDGLADAWDLDLQVAYDLGPDGSATAEGRVRITTSQGVLLREQLGQASAQQREGAARNFAGQMIPGLDLAAFEFTDLARRGAPLELSFSGTVPGFVRERGGTFQAALPIRPTGLATGVGPAQRRWPLAMRFSQRQRVSVAITGEGWRVAAGPQAYREVREGFEHALAVVPEDGRWTATRTFLVRGAVLQPAEVPAFLARESELEREIARAVELERVE